jgi:hypothetical protein
MFTRIRREPVLPIENEHSLGRVGPLVTLGTSENSIETIIENPVPVLILPLEPELNFVQLRVEPESEFLEYVLENRILRMIEALLPGSLPGSIRRRRVLSGKF